MSTRELRRAEVLGRVKSKTLRLDDAAKIMELSYRQTKRLWKRYREEGAKGLQHRSAGRGSNCAKPEEFRRKGLQLIRTKYSGTEQQRFGPALAAEHLAGEAGLAGGDEALRRWMVARGLWRRIRSAQAQRTAGAPGDPQHRGKFTASERSRGEKQRGTARWPGKEGAAQGDPGLRSRECVFGSGISS